MDFLTEFGKIVADAKAHRNRMPYTETLYGWNKEQWAWAMMKYQLANNEPLNLGGLTAEDALDIQAWWKDRFDCDPPKWANELFARIQREYPRLVLT